MGPFGGLWGEEGFDGVVGDGVFGVVEVGEGGVGGVQITIPLLIVRHSIAFRYLLNRRVIFPLRFLFQFFL